MSIEETESEVVELQPANSGREKDRDSKSTADVRPAAAVPLTHNTPLIVESDIDDEDEPEIELEGAGYDEPQFLSGIDPATWVLRLVELLLATAILYLFL